MTQILQTQALVLSTLNFRDHDRILTLLSEKYGLIKILVYGGSQPKKRAFCEPFTLLDLTYKQKNQEIHTFYEAKILDAHLSLRNSFETLTAAMKLMTTTLKTQCSENPAPKIFWLLLSYLKKMPSFENPTLLVRSYQLKTLLAEGLWTLKNRCCKCQNELETYCYFRQNYWCLSCAPLASITFELDEMQTLSELIAEKSFSALKVKKLSEKLSEKIDLLWKKSLQDL